MVLSEGKVVGEDEEGKLFCMVMEGDKTLDAEYTRQHTDDVLL